MRKNANFANHKYALRRILLINILKLKQLVSNLYHFAFGREVHTNGMNADGTMSVAAGDPTLSVTPLKGLEMLPDRIPCENSMLDISEYKQSENPLIFTVEGSSMSPEDISNGDKLLCRKVDTDAAKLIGKGKFVVIAVDKEYYDSKNKELKFDYKLRHTLFRVPVGISIEQLIDSLKKITNHTGGDVFKSNTIMTCNWLLGRQREESVGEEENLYIPPSSSLAGKIYKTLMSQVVAGKKFGGLNEVESVRFDLRKSEISELERMGLVPMVNEYSKVMAFSAKTLFNGDNLGLQTYSVVRVFDYITKVLIDFLNRRAFENWTTRTEADLRGQVVKFLDSVMGPNKLIERFKVMKIEQDPNQKDHVLLDIHITPYFPAKSFVIQLAGHKGDNPEDAIWESEYRQE